MLLTINENPEKMDESMIPDDNPVLNAAKCFFLSMVAICILIFTVSYGVGYLTKSSDRRKFILQCIEFKTNDECIQLLDAVEKR